MVSLGHTGKAEQVVQTRMNAVYQGHSCFFNITRASFDP